MTKLDTTVAFLDKHGLWEDMERPNDISYYEVVAPAVTRRFACAPTPPRPIHPARQPPKPQAEPHPNQVGQGTFEGKYATQGKGYRHCIPRVDVSVGEKVAPTLTPTLTLNPRPNPNPHPRPQPSP